MQFIRRFKKVVKHDAIWQYMNGGVGGHVAGELARGAYENGFENYATDVLSRVFELGKKYGNHIHLHIQVQCCHHHLHQSTSLLIF